MSIYRITFSPTGGTQKVANTFTRAFGQANFPVDLSDGSINFKEICFTEKDICVVAVPSFGGRVPEIAISRLEQMNGGNAKAIIIAVYGNRAYDDTLLELQDTLVKSGFNCIAAVAAVAEHSIMHQFAVGRPDAQDCDELADFAEKVRQRVEAGGLPQSVKVPGNRPYCKYDGIPIKPSAGKACNLCGTCASQCPANAIPIADPSQTDKSKCISCMCCVSVCPRKARGVKKLLVAVAAKKLQRVCKDRKKNELFL